MKKIKVDKFYEEKIKQEQDKGSANREMVQREIRIVNRVFRVYLIEEVTIDMTKI